MFQQSLAFFATLLNKDFTAYCNRRLGEAGLMQGQLYFILYVGKHPGCAPKDLVQALRMDIGHTTRTLVKLEQGGFLVQEQNPEDRRAHILRLTEKGEAAFALSHEDVYKRQVFQQRAGICGNGKERSHGQRPDGANGSGCSSGYAGLPVLPKILCERADRRRREGVGYR